MRLYPALEIRFTHWSPDRFEQVLAILDDFAPTALEEGDDHLRAFFAMEPARNDAIDKLRREIDLAITAIDVSDEDWAARSQAGITPIVVGKLTIAPPWTVTDELRASAPGPIIVIQPSMGFGTGHHASTRLCLRLLQQIPLAGKSVIDVGTGSGVLAIAASVLGAARVLGVDMDPDALANARENLTLNGLSQSVSLEERDLSAEASVDSVQFDVILANLTGGLLIRDARRIADMASRGASLILSGFQHHEVSGVVEAFQSLGCAVQADCEEETWAGTRLVRASGLRV